MSNHAIKAERLTKHFGNVLAVQSLDLRVRQGEIYGFLGQNGAGKTTTIRALLGMIRPNGGRISVLGQEGGPGGRGPWSRLGHLMAAGVAVFSLLTEPSGWNLFSIGILLFLGGLASFLHLGTKKNAWRSIFHLRKSWLSSEVLMASLFGLSWLFSLTKHWLLTTEYWMPVTASLGIGLVYSMARVYRLRSVPAWNSWRINCALFMTTGIRGMAWVGLGAEIRGIWILLLVFLAGQLALVLSARGPGSRLSRVLRAGLLLVGMALTGMLLWTHVGMGAWLAVPLFLILLVEEIIGRWKFYEALQDRLM